MGLDLVPLGKAKPNMELEWQKCMEVLYADPTAETEEQRLRRLELSVLPYECVGAPRVGEDPDADEWILAKKKPDETLTDKELLRRAQGYYVLALAPPCDGLPQYSHADLYEGVDATSFRGAFLDDCTDYLDKKTLEQAWTDVMRPEEALAYGQQLLSIATSEPTQRASSNRGLLSKLFGRKSTSSVSNEEQQEILNSAGKWYIYWASRGHPIHAYY